MANRKTEEVLAEANEARLQAEQNFRAALNTVDALKQRVFQLEMQIVDGMAAQIARENVSGLAAQMGEAEAGGGG